MIQTRFERKVKKSEDVVLHNKTGVFSEWVKNWRRFAHVLAVKYYFVSQTTIHTNTALQTTVQIVDKNYSKYLRVLDVYKPAYQHDNMKPMDESL